MENHIREPLEGVIQLLIYLYFSDFFEIHEIAHVTVIDFVIYKNLAAGRSVQTSVQKAIENTKRRQAPAKLAAVPNSPSSQQRPGRMEKLDVDKLNLLIKSIDKTWIMPRSGTKDPVGSNFQV